MGSIGLFALSRQDKKTVQMEIRVHLQARGINNCHFVIIC